MALLGPESLQGRRLAISVSESADLDRLGLSERHFRLTLAEVARSVLVSGGELSYGGYVDPEGYGAFFAGELHRFGRKDRPFHSVLALSEHARVPLTQLKEYKQVLGLYGDLVCLDEGGTVIPKPFERQATAAPIVDQTIVRRGLTSMRRYLTESTDARIFVGGKRTNFQGELPGIIEECLMAAMAGQPIYLVGGLGGATSDIAALWGLADRDWIPPRDDAADHRYPAALETVRDLDGKLVEKALDNGLSPEEQRRLATTHRSSEVASLISLGFGRRLTRG